MAMKEVHIGLPKNPKSTNSQDYCDDEAVARIVEILHESQNLFHANFAEMRGIVRDLGEMEIPL